MDADPGPCLRKIKSAYLTLATTAVALGPLGKVHVAALGAVPVTRLLRDTHVHAVGTAPNNNTSHTVISFLNTLIKAFSFNKTFPPQLTTVNKKKVT